MDIIYVKVRGSKIPVSLPLCEITDGSVVKEKTDALNIVLLYEGKVSSTLLSEFIKFVQKSLQIGVIESFVIQPEGEYLMDHVQQFLERYAN